MALLEVVDISKRFAGNLALDKVYMNLEDGQILCLLGPSGCGKTTLLRIIAGLETPDSGKILFNGRNIMGVLPHKRRFGMMFQDFALFPHKNVFENVAYGLKVAKIPVQEIHNRVAEMLDMVGMTGFEKRDVGALSGGERQRVALARCLAPKPGLVMLDEPLGSLDRVLREKLMLDLRRILKAVGVSVIFVTHDQAEAFALSDMIAVFNKGKIEQTAPPRMIYRYPKTPYVARFLGFSNLLDGMVTKNGKISTEVGIFYPENSDYAEDTAVAVLVRPDALHLMKKFSVEEGRGPLNEKYTVLSGRIKEQIFMGRYTRVCIHIKNGIEMVFDFSSDDTRLPETGAIIDFLIEPKSLLVMENVV